ncbi:MAG: acyltransferase [bacterium]|nr:acyltransferase [bacterium]
MIDHLESDKRIQILDSFRFLAILGVLLYHYYSRWTTPIAPFNLYPYGNEVKIFRYGYLGVEFFFIISGFVIAFTLHGNSSLIKFWKKRWIRLFPAMLICSLITYTTVSILDTDKVFYRSQVPGNLLVSLTFLHPSIINAVLKPIHVQLSYLNGSYWSLWPEIQFYLLASLIYFADPKKFFSRFLWIALILFLICKSLYLLKENDIIHLHAIKIVLYKGLKFLDIFNLGTHILWFLFGVIFFQLYSKRTTRLSLIGLTCATLFQFFNFENWEAQLSFMMMMILFLIFIYFPKYLRFLQYKLFTHVGLVSYSIYLIHENIGVLLINKYGGSFGPYSQLFPMIILAGLSIFALILFYYVEKPVMNYLKRKLKINEVR